MADEVTIHGAEEVTIHAEQENRVFRALGGRKAAYGLLASVLLTAMAFPLDASFEAYGLMILGALGLTAGTIAYEDAKRGEP